MGLTTISGTIQAQPLNDNFSYLNQRKNDFAYNVKDYGAIGNGSTDDTASIQATINAVNIVGGGTVFFPDGQYKITSVLTLYANIKLSGASRKSSIILPSTIGQTVFSLVYTVLTRAYVNIQDLGIVAQVANVTAYKFVLAAALSFDNLYIAGTQYTFNLDRGTDFHIFNILVEGTPSLKAGAAIFQTTDIADYIYGVVVIDYQIRNIGNGVNTPAITFYRAIGSYLVNFRVNDLFQGVPADGILFSDDCQGCKVVSSIMGKPNNYGIKFIQPGATPAPSFIELIGVDIDQGQLNSIQIDNASSVNIIGGNITNGLQHGIIIGASITAVLIDGVKIVSMLQQGIQVAANASNFQISNCTIATTNTAILVTAGTSDYYIIKNNDVSLSNANKITDGGTGTHKIISDNLGVNFPVSAQILSGGTKKQTGAASVTVTAAGTVASAAVTFPVAFATAPIITFGINNWASSAGYISVATGSVTTAGFTLYVNSYAAQTIGIGWEATGT